MKPIVRPENMARIETPELAQAFIDEQVEELRAQGRYIVPASSLVILMAQ